MKNLVIAAVGVLVLFGCVEKRGAAEEAKAFVSKTQPNPKHKVEIVFDDRLRIVGYDVEDETWDPGQSETITWYWHVQRPVEKGWRLFTHVSDGKDDVTINADEASVVRKGYPLEDWKAGEFIKDVQTVKLPPDWRTSKAVFYLGVWQGNRRMRISTGPHDKDDRAKVAQVAVEVSAAQKELPRLEAFMLDRPIKLDGTLDEPQWAGAPESSTFVNTMKGTDTSPKSTVRALWDKDAVYFGFTVADDFFRTQFTKHDEHLWKEDCVEIMFDPDGDGQNYFELQVSPRGVAFDTRYDKRRDPLPFGHTSWSSNIEAKVTLDGKLDDEAKDKQYTVEAKIPWASFATGSTPAAVPAPGTMWRMNFYVMDAREKDKKMRYAAWSAPLVGDFHVPARFGQVAFVEPSVRTRAKIVEAVDSKLTPGPMQRKKISRDSIFEAKLRTNVKPQPGEPVLGKPKE